MRVSVVVFAIASVLLLLVNVEGASGGGSTARAPLNLLPLPGATAYLHARTTTTGCGEQLSLSSPASVNLSRWVGSVLANASVQPCGGAAGMANYSARMGLGNLTLRTPSNGTFNLTVTWHLAIRFVLNVVPASGIPSQRLVVAKAGLFSAVAVFDAATGARIAFMEHHIRAWQELNGTITAVVTTVHSTVGPLPMLLSAHHLYKVRSWVGFYISAECGAGASSGDSALVTIMGALGNRDASAWYVSASIQ